jgi:hypothetical protein
MNMKQVLIKIFISLIILVTLISCGKKEWNNPYDEESSPYLDWAPFISINQVDEAVVLEFYSKVTNFDSYVIERSVDNGAFSKVASPTKTSTSWTDNNITSGGKLHKYRIYAKAGNNRSDFTETEITPFLKPKLSIEILQISDINAKFKVIINNMGNIDNDLKTVEVRWDYHGNPLYDREGSISVSFEYNISSYELELKGLNPGWKYYAIGLVHYDYDNRHYYAESAIISFYANL